MSGLNVEKFDLFSKKNNNSNKPMPRPVAVPVISPAVVEEEVKKFDEEFEIELLPVEVSELKAIKLDGDIERFSEEEPVLTSAAFEKPINTPVKSIEVTLKAVEKNKEDAPLRKFETFVAPTFRIPEAHDLELKKIEHFIMRNRKKGSNADSRERITTNTVVRAMIANFLERAGDMDLSNIDNEEMLKERMEKVFKQRYNKKN